MKRIVLIASLFVFSLAVLSTMSSTVNAGSGVCFLCGSGSSCQQCPSPSGKDTFNDRKAWERRGCKVSGTASCSTAVNVKKC